MRRRSSRRRSLLSVSVEPGGGDCWRRLTVGDGGEATEVTVVHTLWLLLLLPSVSVEAG